MKCPPSIDDEEPQADEEHRGPQHRHRILPPGEIKLTRPAAGRGAVAERAHVAQRGVQRPRLAAEARCQSRRRRASRGRSGATPPRSRTRRRCLRGRRPEPRRARLGGKPVPPPARPLGTDAGSPTRRARRARARACAAAADARENPRRRRLTCRRPARLERPGVAAAPAEMTPKLAPRRPRRRAAPQPYSPRPTISHASRVQKLSPFAGRGSSAVPSPGRRRLRT